jgi:hypothetical protein
MKSGINEQEKYKITYQNLPAYAYMHIHVNPSKQTLVTFKVITNDPKNLMAHLS